MCCRRILKPTGATGLRACGNCRAESRSSGGAKILRSRCTRCRAGARSPLRAGTRCSKAGTTTFLPRHRRSWPKSSATSATGIWPWVGHDWKVLDPGREIRVEMLHLACQFKASNTGEYLSQGQFQRNLSRRYTDTPVRSVTKCDLRIRAPADNKAKWLLEDFFVTIGGGYPGHHSVALPHLPSSNLGVLDHVPEKVHDRRRPAKGFPNPPLKEAFVARPQIELLRVIHQPQHGRRDHVPGVDIRSKQDAVTVGDNLPIGKPQPVDAHGHQ